MAAEDIESGLRVPKVVVVNAVVRRPECQVITAGGVEFDATNVGLRFEGGNGVSHVCRPVQDVIEKLQLYLKFLELQLYELLHFNYT